MSPEYVVLGPCKGVMSRWWMSWQTLPILLVPSRFDFLDEDGRSDDLFDSVVALAAKAE